MKEREIRAFSLPALLLVTGFCFLLFALGFRILDGVRMKFFFETGFITFAAGLLTGVCILFAKKQDSEKQTDLQNA